MYERKTYQQIFLVKRDLFTFRGWFQELFVIPLSCGIHHVSNDQWGGGEINMADTENTGITEIRIMSRRGSIEIPSQPEHDKTIFQYNVTENLTNVPPILHEIVVNKKWASNAKKIRVTVDILY